VLESFFDYQDTFCHEISFLFLLSLPAGSPLCDRQEPFGGHEPPTDSKIVFRWFPLDELKRVTLCPSFLRTA
jgi:hypothetical protein